MGARVDPDPALAGPWAEVVLPYPNRDQGNILTGIVNCQMVGCGSILWYKDQNSPFDNSFSNIFLDFNLKQKTVFTNNFVAMYGFHSENNFGENFLYI